MSANKQGLDTYEKRKPSVSPADGKRALKKQKKDAADTAATKSGKKDDGRAPKANQQELQTPQKTHRKKQVDLKIATTGSHKASSAQVLASPAPTHASPMFTLSSKDGPVHFQSHTKETPKGKSNARKPTGLIANMLDNKNKTGPVHRREKSQEDASTEKSSTWSATTDKSRKRSASSLSASNSTATRTTASPPPCPADSKTNKKASMALVAPSRLDLEGPGRPTGSSSIQPVLLSPTAIERRHIKTIDTLASISDMASGCLRQLDPLTMRDTCDDELARAFGVIKMQLWSLKYAADETRERADASWEENGVNDQMKRLEQ